VDAGEQRPHQHQAAGHLPVKMCFSGVNLRSADLRGANLSNAKVQCVSLTNAKLHSAHLPAWSSGLLEGVKLAGEEGVCVCFVRVGPGSHTHPVGGVSVGVCIGVCRLIETRATRS
jgi:uncharacterized protein YjbI with pentapeptide repeats